MQTVASDAPESMALLRHVTRERLENRDLRVGDGVGVVIAVDRADERLASLEVEALHLIELPFDDVDGLFVERGRPAREVGLADDALAIGRIDDDEVVRRDRSQADGVGRIRLVGPVPLPVGVVDEAFLAEHGEDLLHVLVPEALIVAERQLEGRALHVVEQDVQVVGVDERVLGRGVEEVRRVADDELIDRRAARDEHRRRPRRAPAGASRALPGRGNRARVAGHHRHVERADVDAELERIGGHDRAHQPFAQAALDLAPAIGQIAAAIAADHVGGAGRPVKGILQIGRQDLDRQPALREDDQLQLVLQELERHAARLGEIRAPNAELGVHDRRIDEEEELLAARRAAFVDELERLPRQPFGQLARVGDRRRRADEDRIRSVVAADALQPAQDVREMAAEHAAIRVQLVDDDEAQVLEELRPARMMRQDPRVQHVGIAEHDVRLAADRAPRVRRRVAVVGEDADLELAVARDELRQRVQLRELILRQRLGRKEIQRARRRILQDRVQHRRVVAERLARRRRRNRDDIAARRARARTPAPDACRAD